MKRFVILIVMACTGSDGHEPGDLDEVIGATCRDDRDCVSECAAGGDFPGGFCTLPCRDDGDCTADTICADTQAGICLFPCSANAECAFLGASYFCRERRDHFDRRIFVCMSD